MFEHVSWLDGLVILLFWMVIRRARESSVFLESYKFLVVLFCIFVSMHFYSDLSVLMLKTLIFPENMSEALGFLTINGIIYGLLYLAYRGWAIICKIDLNRKNPWGLSTSLAVVRAFFVAGQVILFLLLLNNSHIFQAFRHSLTGRLVASFPVEFYRGSFAVLGGSFSDERINESISGVWDRAISSSFVE